LNKERSEVESGNDHTSLHSFFVYAILQDRETDPFNSKDFTDFYFSHILNAQRNSDQAVADNRISELVSHESGSRFK
jgi:hypothetical protein